MNHTEAAWMIAEAQRARSERVPHVNILLVDDVPANLLALEAVLDHPDYRIVSATSGEEALKHVLREDFAVILLDVQMPGMDGFETARLIKMRDRSKHVPILFVTATNREDSAVFKGYEVGAIDYLFKPVDANILTSKVSVFVELYLSKRQLEHQNDVLTRQAAALESANAALQQADRHKDEFLDVISHELRTPLNFIMGFASILQDGLHGPVTPEQHHGLGQILNGTDRMLQLVNDLLDWSQMQAGRFMLQAAPTNVGEVVALALDDFEPRAHERGLALSSDVPEGLVVPADAQRVRQVLNNLLDNALKFTPDGGCVAVSARLEGSEVLVTVKDTGVGIPEAAQPKLFAPFHQLDMSVTRPAGGTGLGLAIVGAIVAAHGGRLGVESAPDAGSAFWFTLPVGAS
jgi:signal transduction histidine kinase